MKVSTFNNTVVERTGLADDGRFTIAFNSKMAKILADGIYSDKITSIIREISCNAIDSHVAAGKPNAPIEVHLPGIFEPWFHVRDFGIGLDHNEVMNIYTVYGASTKTDTNDMVGCLGLGSKSPFSYVDAFDVTAIKNGIERQYSMYRSEDGMPSVALLMERKTAEPNGVTVKIPVLQTDFNSFKSKAAGVFRWFAVQPTIVGMRDFSIEPVTTLFEGDRWKIIKITHNYGYHSNPTAIALMGRVAYPIHADSVSGLTANQRTLLSMSVVLDFDIGDLEVAASREALGYDSRTQDNIKARLEVVLRQLGENFEKLMSDAKTLWEAHEAFNTIFGYNSQYHYEFGRIFGNQGLKWNNHTIRSGAIAFDTSKVYDPKTAPHITTISGSYRRTRKLEYHRNLSFKCSPTTKIIFDDLERGGASRVNYYHSSNNNNFEITVFGGTPTVSRKEILDLLGNPEYLLTSQLPKRPSNTGARGEKVNMLQYRLEYQSGKKAWTAVDVELEDGGVYVNLDVWTPVRNDIEFDNFYHTICLAQTLGILDRDTPIYAPRGNFKKKLEKIPEWENVFDIISAGLKTRLTPSVLQKVSDVNEFNTAATEINQISMWKTKWNLVDTDGVFSKFVEGMRKLESISTTGKTELNLASLNVYMGNQNVLPAPVFKGADAWNKVEKQYPMIPMLLADRYTTSNLWVGDNRKVIENYINMVDASISLPARNTAKLAA